MTRKTVLSIAFLSLGAAWTAWEIAASVNPRDDLEPLTNLIADYVPPAVAWAAILLLISWIPGHFAEAFAKRGKVMDTTTIPATPEPGAAKEPLLSVGTITAFAAAALALLAALGLQLSDAQTAAILGLIAVGAPVFVAVWARKKVFAPDTVRAMVVTAAKTGQVPTEPVTVPAEPTPAREP